LGFSEEGPLSFVTSRRFGNSQRGGSGVKLFLLLVLLGAMIFAGVKVVPIYVNNYQMQDAIESEARFAIGNRLAPKDIRDNVWKKVNEIGIPADQDSLKITTTPGSVQISLDYSVPVDLLVYKFTLDFHDHADNRSI
jgi:Flp pilus assembly protein TadG